MKFTFLPITIILIILSSCSLSKNTVYFDNNDKMVFPAPPDDPKIQFLTSFSSSSDIEKSSWIDSYLALSKAEKIIVKPFGVTMHQGKIYICDTMLPGIEIIDLNKQHFDILRPYGRGALKKPINVTVDKNGNIYISDSGRKQVVVFDSKLDYSYHIGSDEFKPLDTCIRGDSLIIADAESRNLRIWSLSKAKFMESIQLKNEDRPDSERVFLPYSLVCDNIGNIYVCDFGVSHIQKYDSKGKWLKTIGTMGRSPGQFARPKGIALDKDDNLYVVDAAFENVQIFNENSEVLMFFGGSYQNPGNMYLPAQISIDYDNTEYFEKYLIPGYTLKYIILVSNQFGPDKIGVYGFIEPLLEDLKLD